MTLQIRRMILAALSFPFLALPVTSHAEPVAPEVGFESQTLPDGTSAGIWYPAAGEQTGMRLGPYAQRVVLGGRLDGGHHGLIVFSHGTGGSFAGHYDTAIALARAGFVVAALTHRGDSWQDQSRATDVQARAVALSALIGFMLDAWRDHAALDPARVGAFGFSAGGFTVLAASGGQPDLSRVAAHCAAHPDFFDCRLLHDHPATAVSWRNIRDARIKAIVLAAPALGFAFDRAGLAQIDMPVQLWRADDDRILPAPYYADAVKAGLPHEPEFHAVPGAGHFDFLAPCAPDAAKLPICASAPGFDRSAFHRQFNAAVVRFFQQRL